jgi:hypothetical protein
MPFSIAVNRAGKLYRVAVFDQGPYYVNLRADGAMLGLDKIEWLYRGEVARQIEELEAEDGRCDTAKRR